MVPSPRSRAVFSDPAQPPLEPEKESALVGSRTPRPSSDHQHDGDDLFQVTRQQGAPRSFARAAEVSH